MANPTEYLVMLGERDRAPHELAASLADHAAYRRRLDGAGVLVDAGRLHPSREGVRLHRDGETVVREDGPFDRALASYYQLRAPDLDAALAFAGDCPLADGDALEVRPVMKSHVAAGKLDRAGKVFAFGVYGTAPDEPAWTQIMDRIDDATHDRFPADALGGLRLEGPRTGRRVVLDTRKRVLLDGPFLESKEVIGGLFFLARPNQGDAMEWARTTGFVTLGALEIREVWRI